MSIAVFDKFVNGIPTTVFDGKDVSLVMLVDPPAGLPAFFLANKGVLDTTTKTIKVYDDTGNTVVHDFDISDTDLTPITDAIDALDTRVGNNESAIGTLQSSVSTNTGNIGTNTSNIGSLDSRVGAVETKSTDNASDIEALQSTTGTLDTNLTNLTLRVGTNETNIAAVTLTANAADSLSKANKERLDNLPAPPNLTNYIQNGDDATLNSVGFGFDTKIDHQDELGLVLQGDTLYGVDKDGYEHFFIEQGNFNVKSKKIQKVNDGVAVDDAVNKRQMDVVDGKATDAKTTADAADTLSKSNQTAIGNLSTTVGENSSQISTNTKDISDLSTKVDGVETTANAADTLSKANKDRLDGLPADVTPRVEALEANALQKDADSFDAKSFKVRNLASGEDSDSNAANIGDVKRISTEGSGLKPTDNQWDMLNLPVINVQESTEVTSAATVGQVNAVDAKIPDVSNFIETGTTAVLNAVMFGGDTKVDHQDELGLVLQGDSIYGVDKDGYEHFFIEQGNFNVKSKKIQKVRDGTADDDAATVSQVNTVGTVASAADTLSKSNQTAIGNLSTTVGNNSSQISTNASDISGLDSRVGAVETTASAADTLSKDNKTRLDNLPADVTPRVDALEANALQKDVNGYDAKSFKILNVASGEDTDSSAANIGDVKRIATEGSGLKPTNDEWDMLTYPVINIGTSNIETSAATVGQVNAVDSKADSNAGDISNLSTTVGQHDTQIGTNTSDIAAVTTTANAADTLSKDNKARLDNLPPSPDLSGYVKNGDDVNFGTADINIVRVTKGDDSSKFSDVFIDGNTNTQMNFVGDTHFYIRNKSDNSKGLEALQIDSSARLVAKQKIKTPIITNLSTGTTNSNTDKAGFIDLSQDNELKVGAKNSVIFDVGGNLSAGIYSDNVNFNTDYVTGVKMREESSRQPYDAVNWQTLQSFTPNLDEYAKLDTEVQFSRVNIKNDFADDTKNPYFWCDPANGNTVFAGTGQVYFNRYDHDGTKHRWGIVDTSNRLTLDNAMKATRVNNHQTWTTVSSNDHAGFMRLDLDNRVVLGAKQDVSFQVNGKDVAKVKEDGLDFTGLGATANIKHDNNIDVSVGDTKNVAFKSSGMKILSDVDGGGHAVNHSGDIAFNSGKKLKGSDVGNLVVQNLGSINRNHTNDSNSVTLGNGSNTYKSNGHLFHDNSGNELFFIGPNVNVNNRKLQNVTKSESDADATNLGHIKELIAAGGSGGVDFENYITRSESGSTTFYETTNGQQNAWVVATNSTFQGAMTYTFDYSREGQEVVVGIENRTKGSVIAKLYSRQSTVLTVEVPSYHVFSARYVPEIGKYVYNIGSWYPTEQRVITLEDINPTISSDYRQMTLNIIAAMPSHTTLIGYHNPDISGASKYKFVTTGATGTGKESSKCAVVIHKHINGHAVGLSTTEGLSGGRVYSRVLDGSTGVWNTNSTAASRSLASEIELEGLPEDQIFFTGDQGILESYIVDEETGEAALRPLVGYNVPKHDSDIAALEIQTEKNRSQTHYFINEGSLSYDWPDEARRPLVEVQVLNTMQQINNSSVTVTDNDTHKYSETYNSVGAVAINAAGNWSVQYVYHNAYKHPSENWYVVFNQANMSWQIIEAANPHTSVGMQAASVTVQLGGQSSLPESFGAYTIDPNFDNIDSLEFISAEVPVQYDDINSRVLINFNGAKPSGYVVLK